MKRHLVVVSLGILLVAPCRAMAQQKTVTGTVTTEQGAPLAGVSIVVKGTTIATASGGNGRYDITVTSTTATTRPILDNTANH